MSVTVTLGMILWNQGSLASITIAALMQERERLETAGMKAYVELIDNASWDGTAKVATEAVRKHRRNSKCEILSAPASSTTLRNTIIDVSAEDDFVVFIDGDIEVIPHSIVAMCRYVMDNPSVSAIAMDPLLQRSDRAEADGYCRSIAITRQDPLMYLCGYGVFDRTLFNRIQFDEAGPLGQCGWGSEDDDLWLQMVDADYKAVYASGYSYYHPEPRSSWGSLEKIGIDPMRSFATRREYVVQKWRDRRSEKVASRLTLLEGQHVRPR